MSLTIRCGPKSEKGLRKKVNNLCKPYCPYWEECQKESELRTISLECIINFIRAIFHENNRNKFK
jgi:hypothetical protein